MTPGEKKTYSFVCVVIITLFALIKTQNAKILYELCFKIFFSSSRTKCRQCFYLATVIASAFIIAKISLQNVPTNENQDGSQTKPFINLLFNR